MWQRMRSRMSANSNYAALYTVKAFLSMLFHMFMKIMGPALVLIASALILAILYMYYVYILPVAAGKSTLSFLLHSAAAGFFAFNILFNYANCVRTNPGSPKPIRNPTAYFLDAESEGARVHPSRLSLEVAPHVKYRYCVRCRSIKPPRAHHDTITGKCVFHMDHYCPWLANCVGYYNYRYFVLFLFHMFCGCVYALTLTTGPFLDMPKEDRRLHMRQSYQSAVSFVFMITLSIAISVGLLLCWHIYLVFTNQTTIEYYINYEERSDAMLRGEFYRNPYDLGWRKNLRRVFGDQSVWVMLLPSLAPPPPPPNPWLPPMLNGHDDNSESEHLLASHTRTRARPPGSRRKDNEMNHDSVGVHIV